MKESYDIINQLGPQNRFDRLAGEAQVAGYRYNDRSLVNLGTELGNLIREIRYDSDRYYLITAKADEIEKKIKSFQEKEKKETFDKVHSPAGYDFSFYQNSSTHHIQISVDMARAPGGGGLPDDKFREKFEKQLLDFISSTRNIKKSYGEGNGLNHMYEETETWEDKDNNVIFYSVDFSHSNGYTSGLEEGFYFLDPNDTETVKKFWKELKDALGKK